jgi:hypothetical protein
VIKICKTPAKAVELPDKYSVDLAAAGHLQKFFALGPGLRT